MQKCPGLRILHGIIPIGFKCHSKGVKISGVGDHWAGKEVDLQHIVNPNTLETTEYNAVCTMYIVLLYTD